ncbi:hypothetical protein ElyMa_000028900 [Elysia marginata]|uniref:Uncharacterized protein n=1 Tax=Elysia marginata TaxID=1093978 RepID=A0AAV4EBP4_9GAST|nr:hypothetical protein ElyMa_000028900 [Elysia marginata]
MRKPYCLSCSEATCCSRVTMYTFIRRACSDAIYLAAATRRQPATSGTINTPMAAFGKFPAPLVPRKRGHVLFPRYYVHIHSTCVFRRDLPRGGNAAATRHQRHYKHTLILKGFKTDGENPAATVSGCAHTKSYYRAALPSRAEPRKYLLCIPLYRLHQKLQPRGAAWPRLASSDGKCRVARN